VSVTIVPASYLRQYVDGKESVSVRGKTVRGCLEALVKKHPGIGKMLFDEDGKLHSYVSVASGGEIVYSEQLDRPVKDGDTLNILYIIGGG
jgi:molybdopterin converting factor small subunit